MGMTIEEIIKYLPAPICGDTVIGEEKQKEYDAHDSAVIILRKYQKMQADYEARLKADMIAMLEEINLKFDEQYHVNRHELHNDCLNIGLEQGQKIIQQKIDKIKGL